MCDVCEDLTNTSQNTAFNNEAIVSGGLNWEFYQRELRNKKSLRNKRIELIFKSMPIEVNPNRISWAVTAGLKKEYTRSWFLIVCLPGLWCIIDLASQGSEVQNI